MEESPAKRRRTSPRTAQPVQRATTPNRDSPAAVQRSQRPSFASPTKSSLARYNPQILERRQSASPSKSSPARPASRRRLGDAASERSMNDLLTAQLESDAASALASETSRRFEKSPGPSSAAPSSSAPVPRIGGSLAAAPRRSPAKPKPRPLPPPAPDGDDDLNPFIGRTLRRSPTTGVNIPPRPEPELPPSVPDPVTSTPPRGIHSSSPSRWREKSKPVRESPLKQPPLRPDGSENEPSPAKRLFPSRAHKSNVRAGSVLGQVSDNPRRVVPYDPNLKKRKRVEALKEKIHKLEGDLKLVDAENDRLRAAQGSGRALNLVNEKGTFEAIQKHLLEGADQVQPRQSEILAKAAYNPTALLPFTRPARLSAPVTVKDDIENIKSHYPVQMTAEKELPYLQLFGSFDVASTVAMMAPTPDGTLRQRHMITLRSRDAPGFFSSKIEMVVNAMNLTILDLRVVALEPSARAELEQFVGRICSGDCNRSMQRNVGILSWAMGDWLRIALQRATLWARLDQQLGAKNGLHDIAAKARRSARHRTQQDEGSADEADTSKHHLLRFMGQQNYDVPLVLEEAASSKCSLRLSWKIACDWTGEAESTIDLALGVPGKWHNVDSQGVLGKLPQLFRNLVDGGEPTAAAVGTIIALLMGES